MVGGWKSGRIQNILISLIFVWLGVEKWRDEKMSLNKFTHIPLLKNDAQLKTKMWQITKNKKEQSPKFIKKKCSQKKNHV